MEDCPAPIRRRGRLTRRIGLVVAVTLLSAVGCAGPTKSLYPRPAGETPRTVYVINHGALHTGLAVKRSDIPRGSWPANRDYAGSKYIEVGWGDDDGYRKPLTSGIALKALAGSKRTVLLTDGFNTLGAKLENPKFSIVEVDLSARRVRAIMPAHRTNVCARRIRAANSTRHRLVSGPRHLFRLQHL